jgi:hypothetical protein
VKVHLSKVTPNRWGGFNTTSLCGRLNKQSRDGMNLTATRNEVTCGFCLKLMKVRHVR